MPRKIFYAPQNPAHRSFYWWSILDSGLGELEDWLNTFTAADLNKLTTLIYRMSQTKGPKLHPSSEKYNHEFDKIGAIKSGQIRLYGCLEGNDFVILFYDQKKKQKLTRDTKTKIEARYASYRNEQQ